MKRFLRRFFLAVPMLLLGHSALGEGAMGWGLGTGLPYGVLGVNLDRQVRPNIYVSAGLGAGYSEPGWALGGHYYPAREEDPNENFRPRLSLFWGTYGSVERLYTSPKSEDFQSLALGGGFQWTDGKDGFDLDVLFVSVAGAKDRVAELRQQGYYVRRRGANPITFSLGYRHLF